MIDQSQPTTRRQTVAMNDFLFILPAICQTIYEVVPHRVRPPVVASGASKTFRLLTKVIGLPIAERTLDLSGQDSLGCSPLPAALVNRRTRSMLCCARSQRAGPLFCCLQLKLNGVLKKPDDA